MNDALGDRMKRYEASTKVLLPRRTYTILRLDGVAFHTYTRGMRRPYDNRLMTAMQETLRSLCEKISGTVLGYQQSDEITLVVQDFAKPTTEAWYGSSLQKIASVSAAIATRDFNRVGSEIGLPPTALFDSRVFTIPDPVEVANNLIWRQQDAIRNSISMCAQAQFSHTVLQGKGTNDMLDMLHENGTPWQAENPGFKNGVWCIKNEREATFNYTDKRSGEMKVSEPVMRSFWEVETAPTFTAQDAGPLMARIPLHPYTAKAVLNRAR